MMMMLYIISIFVSGLDNTVYEILISCHIFALSLFFPTEITLMKIALQLDVGIF